MQHKGTVELDTDRLILRRLEVQDANAMYSNWAGNPEVTKYLTWPAHTDASATAHILHIWNEQYEKNIAFYQWAIVPKELGEPIGTMSVLRLDAYTDAAEIGYCIGQKWWHCGYTSEALKAVMSFLFRDVKINRLEARHDTHNPHSGEVMKKCGMKFEGILRSAARNNQGIVDVAVYSILAQEYENCS